MSEEKKYFFFLLIISFAQTIYLNLISLFHFNEKMTVIVAFILEFLPIVFFIVIFLKIRKNFVLNKYKIFIIFLLFIISQYIIFLGIICGIADILTNNITYLNFISSDLIAYLILLLIWLIFVSLFFLFRKAF
jgi:hypothetical protein